MDGSHLNLLGNLQELHDCLEQEQQALIGSNYINLDRLVQNKAILLDQLELCRKDIPIATQTEQILFKKIEMLNLINQRIAARLQTSLGDLMHILRGNPNSPSLYDAAGKKSKTNGFYKPAYGDYAKA